MVGVQPSQPFLGTTLWADTSRQPVRDARGVIWLKNEMCYKDWSSYPGNDLWAGDGKALFWQRWAWGCPCLLVACKVS